MKKILIAILFVVIIFPSNILAKGYISVSPSSLTVEKGKTAYFKITAYNAIGDVTIKSNSTSIAKVGTNEWSTGVVEEDKTKTVSIKVTGVSIGKTTITLSIDGATFDSEDLSGQTKTVTVNVVEPVVKPTLSKNTNLKSITIDGFELSKVKDNNYSLVVNNDVEEIEIKAEAEDKKSKVSGTGKHKLNIGENNLEVVVTSESGSKSVNKVQIIRKDGYYFEDIDTVLTKGNTGDIDVIIKSTEEINEEVIKKIKESKKTIKLSYINESKEIEYSWIIDGGQVENIYSFSTSISFDSEQKNKINELSNYANVLYLNFKHGGILPKGTNIKVNVVDKFENDNNVNLYYFNEKNNSLELVNNGLKVVDGFVEFNIEHCSDYILTMSNIVLNTTNSDPVEENNDFNMFMVISIIELIVIVCLIILFLKNKKSNNNVKVDMIPQEVIEGASSQENVDNTVIEESVVPQKIEVSQEFIGEVSSEEIMDNIVREETVEVSGENVQNENIEETP